MPRDSTPVSIYWPMAKVVKDAVSKNLLTSLSEDLLCLQTQYPSPEMIN